MAIHYQTSQPVPQAQEVTFTNHEDVNDVTPNRAMNETMDIGRRETNLSSSSVLLQSAEPLHLTSDPGSHDHQTQTYVPPPSDLSNEPSQSGIEQQSYDVWPPFFHPTMQDILPDSEMLNLPQVNMRPIDLDYFELENWFMATNP